MSTLTLIVTDFALIRVVFVVPHCAPKVCIGVVRANCERIRSHGTSSSAQMSRARCYTCSCKPRCRRRLSPSSSPLCDETAVAVSVTRETDGATDGVAAVAVPRGLKLWAPTTIWVGLAAAQLDFSLSLLLISNTRTIGDRRAGCHALPPLVCLKLLPPAKTQDS